MNRYRIQIDLELVAHHMSHARALANLIPSQPWGPRMVFTMHGLELLEADVDDPASPENRAKANARIREERAAFDSTRAAIVDRLVDSGLPAEVEGKVAEIFGLSDEEIRAAYAGRQKMSNNLNVES